MSGYQKYSFWLETAGEPLQPRPALAGSIDVDVAILGAGFSGLWTAYYLSQQHPDWTIAIVEKDIAGYGASGRNGGWCSPRFPVSPIALEARFGLDQARAVVLAMEDSVLDVRRVCELEQIDAQYHLGGILNVARGAHQERGLLSAHAQYARMGLGDRYRLLDREQTLARVDVNDARGSMFTETSASVHPARLVRGLARAVERRGVTIFEQTAVTSFHGGENARLVTAAGEVRARRGIVLAGEAYLSRLPGLRRALLPLYSLIGLTAPLSSAQWERIGWSGRESLNSRRLTVDYLTRTEDGRILFGSRGAPYLFGSKITDRLDRHEATHAEIRRRVFDWFPSLRNIEFSHAWGGPVGAARDWMPSVAFDAATRIGTARGYTGVGVATTNLAGRTLASLISGKADALTALPMAQYVAPRWEREPLRWLGVRYVQNALGRIDAAAEAGRAAPIDARIALWLERH